MPPNRSRSPTRFATAALTLVVRFKVPWGGVDDFLLHYGQWFQPVDDALSDEENGRTTEVLIGEIGDAYNVIFIYRYRSLDRGAFYSVYEAVYCEKHHLEPGEVSAHIMQHEIEWMDMATDFSVRHRAPLDADALRGSQGAAQA